MPETSSVGTLQFISEVERRPLAQCVVSDLIDHIIKYL
jgi:hypothetical protein